MSSSRGFTLIELVIVIAIVAIVVSLGLPSIRTYLVNTQIRNAMESIQSGIRIARAEAVKRNAEVEFSVVGASDPSWQVKVVSDSSIVTSYNRAEGAKSVEATLNPASKTVVKFDGLGRVLNSGTDSLQQIDIGVPSASGLSDVRPLRVLIGAGGTVRTCDPKISTALIPPDPKAC